MREVPLTRGMVALVDEADYAALATQKWHAIRPTRSGTYYAARRDPQNHYIYMHRQIIGAVDGQRVDHRDGNGLLNSRSNLRFATQTQNAANQVRLPVTNTSGYRGVSWYAAGQKWAAFIRRDGRSRYLGYFTDPIEAAKAYDQAAVEIHGEFARPNFT